MVVRRVLLGPREGLPQEGDVADQLGEDETEVGDVTGREVTDLVADDEAQRLGVAGLPTDLEQVGVDGHKASEAVAGCEGVDLTVAQHHVSVGDSPQAELLGRLDNHSVALRELGGRHLHRARPQLGVRDGADDPHDEREEGDDQDRL